MEALVEKLCNRFSGVTGIIFPPSFKYSLYKQFHFLFSLFLTTAHIDQFCLDLSTDVRQWEHISYCLSQLSFTEKGMKKLIDLFKTYEHALSEDSVMDNFRNILNKVMMIFVALK